MTVSSDPVLGGFAFDFVGLNPHNIAAIDEALVPIKTSLHVCSQRSGWTIFWDPDTQYTVVIFADPDDHFHRLLSALRGRSGPSYKFSFVQIVEQVAWEGNLDHLCPTCPLPSAERFIALPRPVLRST